MKELFSNILIKWAQEAWKTKVKVQLTVIASLIVIDYFFLARFFSYFELSELGLLVRSAFLLFFVFLIVLFKLSVRPSKLDEDKLNSTTYLISGILSGATTYFLFLFCGNYFGHLFGWNVNLWDRMTYVIWTFYMLWKIVDVYLLWTSEMFSLLKNRSVVYKRITGVVVSLLYIAFVFVVGTANDTKWPLITSLVAIASGATEEKFWRVIKSKCDHINLNEVKLTGDFVSSLIINRAFLIVGTFLIFLSEYIVNGSFLKNIYGHTTLDTISRGSLVLVIVALLYVQIFVLFTLLKKNKEKISSFIKIEEKEK